jgi:hypothetical protein
MKQITCEAMGGPEGCTEVITGNTPDEMVKNGMKHMSQAHPELAAKIMSGTPQQNADNENWMKEFSAKFDTLEDA